MWAWSRVLQVMLYRVRRFMKECLLPAAHGGRQLPQAGRYWLRPCPPDHTLLLISPQAKTPAQFHRQVKRLRRKDARKRKQLQALGVDYEFPGVPQEGATAGPRVTLFTDSDNE